MEHAEKGSQGGKGASLRSTYMRRLWQNAMAKCPGKKPSQKGFSEKRMQRSAKKEAPVFKKARFSFVFPEKAGKAWRSYRILASQEPVGFLLTQEPVGFFLRKNLWDSFFARTCGILADAGICGFCEEGFLQRLPRCQAGLCWRKSSACLPRNDRKFILCHREDAFAASLCTREAFWLAAPIIKFFCFFLERKEGFTCFFV